VTVLAEHLNDGDRARFRAWSSGKIAISPANLDRVTAYIVEAIEQDFGAPVLWWDVEEEKYLIEGIRPWFKQLGSAEEAVKREGWRQFHGAYNEASIFRCCAHDAPETPGASHADTLRRVILNVVGMHVARGFAESYPKAPDAKSAAFLARHRARTAAALLYHALNEQGHALSSSRKAQLKVIAAYIRIHQVAIPSRFRESLAQFRGTWFFHDNAVVEEVHASCEVDLLKMLPTYKLGHPDRFIIAANALVFASLQHRLQDAVTAWEIMCDEQPAAADLSTHFASHERPLSNSPDLLWLITQNGGSTVLTPNSPVYVTLTKGTSP
jgi:hypothetical protein